MHPQTPWYSHVALFIQPYTVFIQYIYPVGIYMFKVNNRNTRSKCEICSKLTMKTPERGHWRRSGVFIVNFEHVIDGWDIEIIGCFVGR